ncbi:MAG TPA: DUF488 family protein [Terracidiphilus sp.]|nr:DUF488 family protein [Terracidiphilus sp.]
MANKVQLKRVFNRADEQDGSRFFVERQWPRGVDKSALAGAAWLGEVAPSPELSEWFHHDPKYWDEFRRRYFAELKYHTDALSPILEAARKGTVTLLYTCRDKKHNNAVALREFLMHSLNPKEPASCLCLQ